MPRRKSSRLIGLKQKDYTQVNIIEENVRSSIAEQKAFLERKKKNTTEEVLKKSMEWLKATREKISEQSIIKNEVSSSGSSSEMYKSKSISKWGKGVFLCPSSTSSDFDWEAYYVSRLSTPCKVKSPLLLLQEMYNDCKYISKIRNHLTE